MGLHGGDFYFSTIPKVLVSLGCLGTKIIRISFASHPISQIR